MWLEEGGGSARDSIGVIGRWGRGMKTEGVTGSGSLTDGVKNLLGGFGVESLILSLVGPDLTRPEDGWGDWLIAGLFGISEIITCSNTSVLKLNYFADSFAKWRRCIVCIEGLSLD